MITFSGAIILRSFPPIMISIGLMISCIGLVFTGVPHFRGKSIILGTPFVILVLSPFLWAMEWVTFSMNSLGNLLFSTMILYLLIFVFVFIGAFSRKLVLSNSRFSNILSFVGGTMAGIANSSYGMFISTYGSALTGVITLISVPASVALIVAVPKERYSILELAGLAIIGIGLIVALIL